MNEKREDGFFSEKAKHPSYGTLLFNRTTSGEKSLYSAAVFSIGIRFA